MLIKKIITNKNSFSNKSKIITEFYTNDINKLSSKLDKIEILDNFIKRTSSFFDTGLTGDTLRDSVEYIFNINNNQIIDTKSSFNDSMISNCLEEPIINLLYNTNLKEIDKNHKIHNVDIKSYYNTQNKIKNIYLSDNRDLYYTFDHFINELDIDEPNISTLCHLLSIFCVPLVYTPFYANIIFDLSNFKLNITDLKYCSNQTEIKLSTHNIIKSIIDILNNMEEKIRFFDKSIGSKSVFFININFFEVNIRLLFKGNKTLIFNLNPTDHYRLLRYADTVELSHDARNTNLDSLRTAFLLDNTDYLLNGADIYKRIEDDIRYI